MLYLCFWPSSGFPGLGSGLQAVRSFLHADLERRCFPEAGSHSGLLETLGGQHVGSRYLLQGILSLVLISAAQEGSGLKGQAIGKSGAWEIC